jgi:hypothetical protein
MNLLTARHTTLLEKLMIVQWVKKILNIFYGTQEIITVFTRARHLTVSLAT